MTPRRLAAIVAGDICGYSHLMQLDEEGTHARVKRIQRDLIEPSIAEHHGRLVKTTGDGFFAIFDSPVEAVRCGVVIQQNLTGRNASLPRDHRIEFRIGVNLGDVIIEADDIYGDGVNIASRLESIAEPGQVFISGGIYEQIKHKLVCGYESLGDRKVKNITDPIRVYRVLPDPAAFNRARKRRESILIFLLSLLLLAIAGGALWYLLPQPLGRVRNQALTRLSPDVSQALPGRQSAPPAPARHDAARQDRLPVLATPVLQQPPSQQAAAPVAPPQPAPAVQEPEMNTLRGGTFMMGSNEDSSEKPVHHVTIKPFAISRYPISVREWNECAAAKACAFLATGKGDAPVTNVSWSDSKQFAGWLAGVTHKPYRLPTEAEWEFAARGGTQTRYWWGDDLRPDMANCKGCTDVAALEQAPRIGSFKPNPFGLYDMGGTVDQWVEDCWHKNYGGAPTDGSAWTESDCGSHVIRSGSWKNDPRYVRPANRDSYDTSVRYPTHGFRIALSP
ncbi:MAG TPA: SUMF1/EgtB/PvdO family nonheme iron enzyme [Bradyrhizobium sp.]|uniref:SUMF1/EgtB/PvdO family nonheme iron enzyme n=1 Tax=Bradyrhizobium sp. TaxID=376 RepID=UPI002C76985B|nr:SUMF1/EgtB/PvdO family nonheme iron enzyme [Bradyrhizobium sp.]HLZ01923.1 SUMF1/EgtB/PvdO family nonheme iron enzyme [Bradyrhizobium sp.]